MEIVVRTGRAVDWNRVSGEQAVIERFEKIIGIAGLVLVFSGLCCLFIFQDIVLRSPVEPNAETLQTIKYPFKGKDYFISATDMWLHHIWVFAGLSGVGLVVGSSFRSISRRRLK